MGFYHIKSTFLTRLAARTPRAAGRGAGGRLQLSQRLSPGASRLPRRARLRSPAAAVGVPGRAATAPERAVCSGAAANLKRLPLLREGGAEGCSSFNSRCAPRRSEFQINRDTPGSRSPGTTSRAERWLSPRVGRDRSPRLLRALGNRVGSRLAVKSNFRSLGHVCKAVTLV